jgi:hypothetical protein
LFKIAILNNRCLIDKVFHCDISMYVWIRTRIGSSPLFFSFLP